MSKQTVIKSTSKLTSFIFYTQILPQLHTHFIDNHENKVFFDFSNVDRINPLVIPNLLNVGEVIKTYYNDPPDIFIPWDIKLLSYLADMNFFYLLRHHNLFKLDERFIGGYPTSRQISDICYAFYLPLGISKEELFTKHLSNYFELISRSYNETDTVNILSVITELCHNGCNHSSSRCFASFQVNKNKKFQFSVSDSGIGYFTSFVAKLAKNETLWTLNRSNPFQSREDNNINAILEAIFYRYRSQRQGIFDVFKLILPLGGVVRIHTDNTQMIFTQSNFETYLSSTITLKIIGDIIQDFKRKNIESADTAYSPLRITNYKFDGVHIEIEIPFK